MPDPNQELVKQRLEALGFEVAVVPEVPGEKRPDLRVLKDGTTMFVEVKTRLVDSVLRGMMESVRIGATESLLVPLDKRNSLSTIVEKANIQLGAAADQHEFRLLWFRAANDVFVQNPREQIGATLLGIRMVLAVRNGQERPEHCIYAAHADFFRYREIDGAMIEDEDGAITLILNQFSPRHEAFACSPICEAIAPAVMDVQRSERENRCYVIDSNVNRKDDDALLGFLRTKYPTDEFLHFLQHASITTVTTIDAREKGRLAH
jgi:hypothetical protein